MKAYVEHHAKMQQISEAQDFFNQQSEFLRQKLAASEGDLRKARERAGTLAGQQTEVHERLNEFNAELSRARIARVEQEQRMAFLEQTLARQGRTRGHAGAARARGQARRPASASTSRTASASRRSTARSNACARRSPDTTRSRRDRRATARAARPARISWAARAALAALQGPRRGARQGRRRVQASRRSSSTARASISPGSSGR